MPAAAPKTSLVLALMALLTIVWGSTWFVIKIGLRDLPVLTGAGIRFVAAGAVMALVARALAAREGGARPLKRLVLSQAVFQFSLNYGLVYYAETELPSGLVSVLWSVFPLMMAFTESFVLRSVRLHWQQWFGLTMAFVGIVLLFVTDVAAVSARAVPVGLLLLLAPAGVVFATMILKRDGAGTSSLLLSRDSMLLGGALLLACAFVFERPTAIVWTASAVVTLAYLALFGSVLTFGVYFWLLRFVPAYRLSVVSYVTPVVALTLGAIAGSEPLGATTLLGTALSLGGVALVMAASTGRTGRVR